MSKLGRYGFHALSLTVALGGWSLPALAQNDDANPYETVPGVWAPLPDGRAWGSTSAVATSPDGETIWALDRCGANSCEGVDDLDVVFEFDKDGAIVEQWGAGMFVWPHGIDVDDDGHVWIADGRANQAGTMGNTVLEFSPDGELLMTLGTPGASGRTHDTFNGPCDVVVAPNGDIFVVDGHTPNGNNRVVKFSSDGTYLMEWGETGSEPGQFRTPHAVAMDSQGLLYVGDRGNGRVQVFEQDGTFVREFHNLGRPSGIAIDADDRIYVADSESDFARNPGYRRGIRVADLSDGFTIAFIPDPEPDPNNVRTSAAEDVAVDNDGNVYGAEVGSQALRKHVLRDGLKGDAGR